MATPEALLLLLEEHGQGLPHPALQPGRPQLLRHRRRPAGPRLLFRLGHLAGQGGRRGAGTAGVGEDVHGGEGAPAYKVQGLVELLLRLAGEAHNEIGGDTGSIKVFPE